MANEPTPETVAAALRVSIGLLCRRWRQIPLDEELSLPESAALVRLDRGGRATASALARLEQISPQSMGATLAGLENRGLVRREADPDDGRRIVLSLTAAGRRALNDRRSQWTQHLSRALTSACTKSELKALYAAAPLLERLADTI